MKSLIISLSVLFLSACVATGPTYKNFWKKDNVSYEQAVTTEASCQYEVGMAKLDPAEKLQIVSACMKKEGFRWETYTFN